MADIMLAEAAGRCWLVAGEAHLDDLLANTLSPEISIELVQCTHPSEVRALWVRHGGDPSGGMPWLVHPNIVARVTGSGGQPSSDHAVLFGPWSALLDEAALAVIATIAAQAVQDKAVTVTLIEYLDPAGPPALADLSRLRLQLIEDQLAGQGVTRDRIGRDRRALGEVPGATQDRLDILIRSA